MAASSVTGIGYGSKMSMACTTSPPGVKVSRIIYIEGDDGTITIDNIPGMTRQDIFQASVIITDTGRVLKDRVGFITNGGDSTPSFDLVKKAKKEKKSIYRSIFDPSDIQDDERTAE